MHQLGAHVEAVSWSGPHREGRGEQNEGKKTSHISKNNQTMVVEKWSDAAMWLWKQRQLYNVNCMETVLTAIM